MRLTVKQVAVGTWYRADMHLPPENTVVVCCDAKGNVFTLNSSSKDWQFLEEAKALHNLAWQIVSKPVEMFFKV